MIQPVLSPINTLIDIKGYERILDSLPHAVYLINASSELIYFNRNFADFFEEAFGKGIELGEIMLDSLPESHREFWKSTLAEVWEKRVLNRTEQVITEQIERYYDVNFRVIDIPNAGECVLVVFEETTYQRLSDEQHVAEELSLKESLLTRDTLLSIISHDLRAPIFQLNSLLFQLQQLPESYDPERIQYYAKNLEERIFHLTNVLENLLRWSSNKRQRLDPMPDTFRLKEVVGETVGLLEPVAAEKLIQIRTQGASSLQMNTDRDMVAFILRNLVSNAIKYSKEKSEIQISYESNPSGEVILKVRDQGVGIARENLDAIFDTKNYFLKPGTSGERGTGLGLKLCQEFCVQLKGKLDIQSEENQGTEVVVTIPAEYS